MEQLKEYMMAEFHLYSETFREVVCFLSSQTSLDAITKVTVMPQDICQCCHQVPTLNRVIVNKSTRYEMTCGCLKKMPMYAKSYLAIWHWRNQKNVLPQLENPLIKKSSYENLLAEAKKDFTRWLTFFSEVQFFRKVWSLHKKTSDFVNLSHKNKNYINAIGALLNLIRKDLLKIVPVNSPDFLSSDDFQRVTKNSEQNFILSRWEKREFYQDKINENFWNKLKESLFVNYVEFEKQEI